MKIVTKTKINKWGNSYGVRLPIEVIEDNDLGDDSPVLIVQNKKSVVIEFLPKDKKINKSDLIGKISKENLHSEVEWGERQGNEIW